LVASLCGLGRAEKLTINLPSGGEFLGWAASGPGDPGAKSVLTKTTSIDLEMSDYPGAKFVYVADRTKNRLAKTPFKPGMGSWTVSDKDFGRIFKADVTVKRGNDPIDAAVVTTDGQTVLIAASSKGVASFYDLPSAPTPVKVAYNIGQSAARPITQVVDFTAPVEIIAAGTQAPVDASSEEPVKPGAEETKSDAAAPKGATPKDQPANPAGSMLVTLGAVAVIAGLGYWALRYYQQNSGQVNEQLEKMGVQIPKPPEDDLASADPLPDPTFKKPVPVQKIVLDPVSDIDLSAAAPVTPITPAASVVTGLPRLLTADGQALDLVEGETVVGREAGLGLSLIDESSVSRRHARFVRVANQVTVEDLGSTNGSFVNGAKLTASTVLRPGDEVRFGAITFRYQG
jgi:hypothetical protein